MNSVQERRISKRAVKKTAWTAEEDMQLVNYINRFGIWNWTQMPRFAGLTRSGKSCRLRWKNYLNPIIRRGNYSQEEDEIIISMRQTMGAGWSAIAEKLPGRTDNEIKNRWHTHLKKRLQNNPIKEDMKAEIGITSNNTCINNSSPNYFSQAPSASDPESANHKSPTSSSNMLNELGSNTSTDDLSIFESYYSQMTDDELPNFDSSETIEDPLEIFWREKISLENDLMEDDDLETNYGQYNPELLSMPQNSYEELMGPDNCSNNYDYWFNLLNVGMDLDEKMSVQY